jgi:hypothetical protein
LLDVGIVKMRKPTSFLGHPISVQGDEDLGPLLPIKERGQMRSGIALRLGPHAARQASDSPACPHSSSAARPPSDRLLLHGRQRDDGVQHEMVQFTRFVRHLWRWLHVCPDEAWGHAPSINLLRRKCHVGLAAASDSDDRTFFVDMYQPPYYTRANLPFRAAHAFHF